MQIRWVEQLILSEQNAPTCPYSKKLQNQTKLKWAGTQMEFVELVYALHEAGSFGKTPLKSLFSLIGQIRRQNQRGNKRYERAFETGANAT